ncbi:MAG: hypothetical protein K2L30_07275 [Duncaniella sp.]|nr:hypothetical protein [Duncaniella sp.]
MTDRHAFRANWHDYNDGVFFVTICCKNRYPYFGNIANGAMSLSVIGKETETAILAIPNHHNNVEVNNYVIMPNHVHLVVFVGARYIAPAATKNFGCLKPPKHGEKPFFNHHNSKLAVVIGTMKASVTRSLRARYIAPLQIWQRGFHEHIIREQQSYDRIMEYIDSNVANWQNDCFYSNN